jgi:hypothetical protein
MNRPIRFAGNRCLGSGTRGEAVDTASGYHLDRSMAFA